MPKISKRIVECRKNLSQKAYPIIEALQLVKERATAKFIESIDVSIALGIDPKKSEQMIRGATVLPHGTGKSVRVAVFAQGANIEIAKNAGADIVGANDLADEIKKGIINFDILIATPDMMSVVGQLGAVLGPRGLMPNPKLGTVTMNLVSVISNVKKGQVIYRNDKSGNLHSLIGKKNFSIEQLLENLVALLTDLKKLRPVQVKGTYFKQIVLSSTMGPGILVDLATLS